MPPTMPSAMELATDKDFDTTIQFIEQLQAMTERMRLILVQSTPPPPLFEGTFRDMWLIWRRTGDSHDQLDEFSTLREKGKQLVVATSEALQKLQHKNNKAKYDRLCRDYQAAFPSSRSRAVWATVPDTAVLAPAPCR
jgi:hypothetical protein